MSLIAARGTAFGDFDNDGDLDAFLPVGAYHGNRPGRDGLLTNLRAVFVDVTAAAGLQVSISSPEYAGATCTGGSNGGMAGGVDSDGDADLVQSSRVEIVPGKPGLALNDGAGGFTDATAAGGRRSAWAAPPCGMPPSSSSTSPALCSTRWPHTTSSPASPSSRPTLKKLWRTCLTNPSPIR
ncbi:MAG: hypothetical protein AB1505_20305 [Candidatus Latescibacterota bacterium]